MSIHQFLNDSRGFEMTQVEFGPVDCCIAKLTPDWPDLARPRASAGMQAGTSGTWNRSNFIRSVFISNFSNL